MVAVKLRGKVTTNKQLIVKLPKDIAPGEVEVILLHEPSAKVQTRRARRKTHPAFGMWAKRKDITDSGDYAAQLRRKVERREDGR